MSGYHPRSPEVKSCVCCGVSYESRDKRTLYCSSTCRTRAFNARHGVEPTKTKKAKGDLNFSVKNVGVTATGAGIPALANYLLNDAPAHKEIMTKLAKLESRLNESVKLNDMLFDFINAMALTNSDIRFKMLEIQKQRQLEAEKKKEAALMKKNDALLRFQQKSMNKK